MNYQESLERLIHHANLPNSQKEDSFSLLDALYQNRHSDIVPDIHAYTNDILACLDVVNQTINTANPKESKGNRRFIDDSLTYAISAILTSGIEYSLSYLKMKDSDQTKQYQFLHEIWRIACGWDAVIAGDIASIVDHVYLEMKTREL